MYGKSHPIGDDFTLPPREISWRIAAVFIGLGAVALMLAQPLLVYLSNQRIRPMTHDFCVLKNGNLIFVDHGLGGSDLFLYDRRTKTRRVIAHTPYLEEDPSLSPNQNQVVCTFADPKKASEGLEIVAIATGNAQTCLRGRFDGVTRPVFSPSGRRIVFTHYGRGWDTPMMSRGRGYLCELNLTTGAVYDLVEKRTYYSIENPLYTDENHITFFGELKLDESGHSKSILATYTRGKGIRNVDLPESAYLRLLSYSRANDSFFALAQKNGQQNSLAAFIERKDLNDPDAWHTQNHSLSDAAYCAATNEILTLNENSHADTIDAISLHNGKTTTILTLPK